MATESIDPVGAMDAATYAFGHRPAGNPSDVVQACDAYALDFGHRPSYAFAADPPPPPPPPAYVEGFLMSAVRTSGARATWVSPGAPDLSGTLGGAGHAPAGAPLVMASITIIKRGFNAA